MLKIVREFLGYLTISKKIWLIPLLLLLIAIGALFIITQGSAVAPFIYTIF